MRVVVLVAVVGEAVSMRGVTLVVQLVKAEQAEATASSWSMVFIIVCVVGRVLSVNLVDDGGRGRAFRSPIRNRRHP